MRSGADADPGLSAAGAGEATALAASIGGECPMRLVTSPLRRARETAVPLAAGFRLDPEIDAAYAELPWRDGQSPADRQDELRRALKASWPDLDRDRRRWRDALIAHALAERVDTVIVTHFIAINALIGAATNDQRVVVFRPRTTSVTELVLEQGRLTVTRIGAEDKEALLA
jgi:broad specificity phosphatase PhoE